MSVQVSQGTVLDPYVDPDAFWSAHEAQRPRRLASLLAVLLAEYAEALVEESTENHDPGDEDRR